MKKKSLIIICLALLVSAAVMALSGVTGRLYKYGQLEKKKQEAMASGEDYVVARGENIEVYNAAAENITKGYALTSSDKTKEDAIEFLAERMALVEEAKRNNIAVSDKEVKDYIALQKEAGKNAVNLDEFERFLEGAQMTYDEYWDSQYEMLEQELYIGKLLTKVQADIEAVEKLSNLTQEEKSSAVKAEIEKYRKEILKKENLVILD